MRRTRRRPAHGTVALGFDDVLVPASRVLPVGIVDDLLAVIAAVIVLAVIAYFAFGHAGGSSG